MTHRTDLEAHRGGRRQLCLHESRTRTGAPQVCIRDLDHPGDHTPVDRRGLPARIAERLSPAAITNANEQPRDPATGKFLAKQEPTPTELAEADTIVLSRPDVIAADALILDIDQRLQLIDDLADRAAANISLEPGLVDLAAQTFDHEVEMFQDAVARLGNDVVQMSRYMVMAAAAQQQGHHPATAYCFVADRLDPVGAAS